MPAFKKLTYPHVSQNTQNASMCLIINKALCTNSNTTWAASLKESLSEHFKWAFGEGGGGGVRKLTGLHCQYHCVTGNMKEKTPGRIIFQHTRSRSFALHLVLCLRLLDSRQEANQRQMEMSTKKCHIAFKVSAAHSPLTWMPGPIFPTPPPPLPPHIHSPPPVEQVGHDHDHDHP